MPRPSGHGLSSDKNTNSAPRHVFREINHVNLLHLRVVHFPEGVNLKRYAQQEDHEQNNPDHGIDTQQHAKPTEQQDDSGSCHRQLGDGVPLAFAY